MRRHNITALSIQYYINVMCQSIVLLFQTLGILRPPLYTMGDGFRGLPAFLSNNFAGNAREEFMYGLVHLKLLTEKEMKQAFESYTQYQTSQTTKVQQ